MIHSNFFNFFLYNFVVRNFGGLRKKVNLAGIYFSGSGKFYNELLLANALYHVFKWLLEESELASINFGIRAFKSNLEGINVGES